MTTGWNIRSECKLCTGWTRKKGDGRFVRASSAAGGRAGQGRTPWFADVLFLATLVPVNHTSLQQHHPWATNRTGKNQLVAVLWHDGQAPAPARIVSESMRDWCGPLRNRGIKKHPGPWWWGRGGGAGVSGMRCRQKIVRVTLPALRLLRGPGFLRPPLRCDCCGRPSPFRAVRRGCGDSP